MKRFRLRHAVQALAAGLLLIVVNACHHEKGTPQEVVTNNGGYPDEIARIIMLRCTTGPTGGGCHNAIGAPNADGLRLDSWDRLFDGSYHGSAVIPYDTVNSPFLYYICPDSNIGPVALPTMPYTGTNYSTTPISRDEYLTIRNWIARGAPDRTGNIPFAENPDTRQKLYITEQGSDILSVVDAARMVVMRDVFIGMTTAIESAHCVRLSKDGQYAYVSFLAGDYLQKIDTRTDKITGSAQLSSGGSSWNVLHISDDGTKIVAADFVKGLLKFVTTADMQVYNTINTGIEYLHGIAATPGFDTIFVTAQYGNTIFKLLPGNKYKLVTLDTRPHQTGDSLENPHEIMMAPDYSKYFVTCEYSNEVRVLNTNNDALLDSIAVPKKPQDMAISHTKPYLFVSCMEATSTIPGTYGAIAIINYNTDKIEKIIYGDFWQPHGITVDDQNGVFYIVSTNQTGPSVGHNHTSGGKHGWYNVYSLETLEPVNTHQYETLVLPYSADSRFKN